MVVVVVVVVVATPAGLIDPPGSPRSTSGYQVGATTPVPEMTEIDFGALADISAA